jgi:hypothetical protein
LKTLLQSNLVNILQKHSDINTKAVFPAYEVSVFLCVMNVYFLNVFVYIFMYVVSACMFSFAGIRYTSLSVVSFECYGLLGLCKECTPE